LLLVIRLLALLGILLALAAWLATALLTRDGVGSVEYVVGAALLAALLVAALRVTRTVLRHA
jgi:hypothetical protein